MRILVIEDIKRICECASKRLRQADHVAEGASFGENAHA